MITQAIHFTIFILQGTFFFQKQISKKKEQTGKVMYKRPKKAIYKKRALDKNEGT